MKIPKGHEQYDPFKEGGKEIPILRSRYDMTTGLSPNNPRQQVGLLMRHIGLLMQHVGLLMQQVSLLMQQVGLLVNE